jgi:hypothetical protein
MAANNTFVLPAMALFRAAGLPFASMVLAVLLALGFCTPSCCLVPGIDVVPTLTRPQPSLRPQHLYNPAKDTIVTAASCTTNCLAPVVKVVHEKLGIVHGCITTIHNLTNTQTIVDAPNTKKSDLRRARWVISMGLFGAAAQEEVGTNRLLACRLRTTCWRPVQGVAAARGRRQEARGHTIPPISGA